jgi:hypothetical protein
MMAARFAFVSAKGSDDSFHSETTGIQPPPGTLPGTAPGAMKVVVFGMAPLFVGSAFKDTANFPPPRLFWG